MESAGSLGHVQHAKDWVSWHLVWVTVGTGDPSAALDT